MQKKEPHRSAGTGLGPQTMLAVQGVAKEKESELRHATDGVSERIRNLEHITSRLQSRLEPVIKPMPPTKSDCDKMGCEVNAPLVSLMHQFIGELNIIIDRLHDIEERLVL